MLSEQLERLNPAIQKTVRIKWIGGFTVDSRYHLSALGDARCKVVTCPNCHLQRLWILIQRIGRMVANIKQSRSVDELHAHHSPREFVISRFRQALPESAVLGLKRNLLLHCTCQHLIVEVR
jgi:hypothetical protein